MLDFSPFVSHFVKVLGLYLEFMLQVVHVIHYKIRSIRTMTAELCLACITSIGTLCHWSKIALSGLIYKITDSLQGVFIL